MTQHAGERSDITGAERRAGRRVAVTLDGFCERLGARSHQEKIETIDLSEGGVAIAASSRLGVGDVVVLTLDLGEEISMGYRGLVVGRRSVTGGRVAANVAFSTMDDEAREPLRRLIATI